MNNTTNKNRIITILRRFESGLTYKDLLKQYKTDFNIELVNGYVYLKRLKKAGLIENYKPPNSIGKILTYKLIPKNNNVKDSDNQLKRENERLKEKSDLDSQILMKMIPLFIKNDLNLENTTEIEDNRIMELIPQCQ